jgi:ferric-dicitrate binding protein FerR (iron transport regulator)
VVDEDVAPGGNKAILTLADGFRISLADVADGTVARQQNIQISKTGDGQLVYTLQKTDGGTRGSKDINMIEVPKGGQYQIVLPDGSKVWLNAASSMRLPLDFAAGGERRVELKGEAYFEITHDPHLPFTVVSGQQTVQVLGTHFNVKAYTDEADVRTSLLEGKVRVTADGNSVVLTPGQQAQFTDHMAVAEVNVDDAIAWKNGYFHFDDERLEDIMRSVARWYDVKVVFEEERLKDETFGAVTTRFASISTLLRIMEQTGNVRFKIENKTIKITTKDPSNP